LVAEIPNPEVMDLVRTIHPEKIFFYLPGLNEARTAALYGLDAATYRAIRSHFDAETHRAAEDLLADPAFARRVDRLPFRPGATVVGVGESDMDDLRSWLEILRHLLKLRRPDDGIRVVNTGVSGQTTTQALARLGQVVGQQPDWIVCALRGNDATRYGEGAAKTLVSVEETAKNLAALRAMARTQTNASWVWMTLWAIDEERVAAYPPFRQGQVTWRSDDLEAVADVIRRQPGPVVDLEAVFGRPPAPELLGPDGLHPSLAGQQVIARTLVEQLSA
jgi:lysophospholipase L1-like esterase